VLPAIGGDRGRLVVEHPLQPFAEAAFLVDADPRVRSFQLEYAQALKASLAEPATAAAQPAPAPDDADDDEPVADFAPFVAQPLSAAGAEWRDVPVERLVAFFRNPCRFLVEKRLGIELRRPEDELQDDEPFVPDVFAGAPLVEVLLPALLDGLPLEEARALALAGTALPAGGFGRRFLERELNALAAFAAQVREHRAQPALPPHAAEVPVVIDGETWHVRAAFADLRPRGLLRHRYARLGAPDFLAAWLPHLLLCATAPPGMLPVTTGIGRDGRFFLTECESPVAVLESLVRLYARGLREPLAFFPKSAWAFVEGDDNLAKAAAAFRPGRFAEHAESADDGVRLAWRGRPDPLAEPAAEFVQLAHAVYGPLRACLEIEA
jgi:exodeoxyribonuclease V gamma subunit